MNTTTIIPVNPRRSQNHAPKGGFYIPEDAELESVTFDIGSNVWGAAWQTWTKDDIDRADFGVSISPPPQEPIIVSASK